MFPNRPIFFQPTHTLHPIHIILGSGAQTIFVFHATKIILNPKTQNRHKQPQHFFHIVSISGTILKTQSSRTHKPKNLTYNNTSEFHAPQRLEIKKFPPYTEKSKTTIDPFSSEISIFQPNQPKNANLNKDLAQ